MAESCDVEGHLCESKTLFKHSMAYKVHVHWTAFDSLQLVGYKLPTELNETNALCTTVQYISF